MPILLTLLAVAGVADGPTGADPIAVTRPMNVAVDWRLASEHPALRAQAAITRQQSHRIYQATRQSMFVPVLLPDRTVLLKSLRFHSGANHYTASMRYRGINVVVHATRRQFQARSPVVGYEQPTWVRPEITRTHGIVTARFSAFGVAYDMDIECWGGEEHALCGSDREVDRLVASLARWSAP